MSNTSPEPVSHVDMALRKAKEAENLRWDSPETAQATAAVGQVYATLALNEQVARLLDQVGTCGHGYVLCPHCLTNAMDRVVDIVSKPR